MSTAFVASEPSPRWRELVLPREHGSWSLALEPVALGLLAAPSVAGGWLAVAVAAGFLCRRPLKLAWAPTESPRRAIARRLLAILLGAAMLALGLAAWVARPAWLFELAPAAVLGAVFVVFDLQGRWREGWAEVAGAAAFASVAGCFAAAAGWPSLLAWGLTGAMLVRAVPTVVLVRALVRRAKGEAVSCGPALWVSAFTALAATMVWRAGLAPGMFPLLAGLLFARAIVYAARSRWRARTLGMIELVIGVIYVGTLAAAWAASRLATP